MVGGMTYTFRCNNKVCTNDDTFEITCKTDERNSQICLHCGVPLTRILER